MQKCSKGFFSQKTLHINSKRSQCNSPGKAFHNGAQSAAWRHNVPLPRSQKLQTDRQTHTQNTATLGSRLSEPRLSISGHFDVGSRHHVFGLSEKNTLWSLEFCYRRKQSCCMNEFWERYNTTSKFAQRSCKRCTIHYLLQHGKLRGGLCRTILGFNHSHVIKSWRSRSSIGHVHVFDLL